MDQRIRRTAGWMAVLAVAAALTGCTAQDNGPVDVGAGIMVSAGNDSGQPAAGAGGGGTHPPATPPVAPPPVAPTVEAAPSTAPTQARTVAQDNACLGGNGGLVVAPGASCVVRETVVPGDVLVGDGASLQLVGATVRGNILAAGPFADVLIAGASVDGDVRLEGGGTATVRATDVGGDVLVEDTGDVVLEDNRLAGRLECEDNGRVRGGGNAAERLEGDCAGL